MSLENTNVKTSVFSNDIITLPYKKILTFYISVFL